MFFFLFLAFLETVLTLHIWNTKAIDCCGRLRPSRQAAPRLPALLQEAQIAQDGDI